MNQPRTELKGSALIIGHPYIDIELVVDEIPHGDEKVLASEGVVSFGGNAVTAAFCCSKLGFVPDLLSTSATDWFGRMFADMVEKYNLYWHQRHVRTFSYSAIFPNNGKRAMVRRRDEDYLHGFPLLNIEGCRIVHSDGLQNDAVLHYFREARRFNVPTSLDGGSLRENMDEILELTDIAIVSLRLCEQMSLTPGKMLSRLRHSGCKVGGVTLGEHGMLWYESEGADRRLPALSVPPEKVIDATGAGDIFHGAYVYSFLTWPERSWEEHFKFARAAAAYAVQHLGNEASLPTVAEVEQIAATFKERIAAAA